MTREELESAKAAALAEVAAEYDAKIAALDEPEPDALALEEAENWLRKHDPRDGYKTLAAWIPKALAKYIMLTRPAAPLMPTAAMSEADIEAVVSDMLEFWDNHTAADGDAFGKCVGKVRATIARLGHGRKAWPSEAELADMACLAQFRGPYGSALHTPYEAALEMARRLREFGA